MAGLAAGSADPAQQNRFWGVLLNAAGLGLVVGLLAWTAMAFSRQIGGVASIWPVNAVVLVWLLRSQRQSWPLLLIAAFVSNVAAGLVWGGSWLTPVGLALCNSLEITLCFMVLNRVVGPVIDLSRRRDLLAFGAVALAGPAISAAASSGLLRLLNSSDFWHNFTVWSLADTLSLVIVAPALFAARSSEIKALLSPGSRLRTLGLLSAQLAAIAAICLADGMGLKSLMFAAFMIPAFGLGVSGAAIGALLGSAVVLGFAVVGPQFAHLGGAELQHQVTILQLFLATTAAMALVIATTLEERRRLRISLATTAREFQMLADNASDMVMRSDLAGRFMYISPALSRISGYEPDELIGRAAVSLVFPEDVPPLVEAVDEQIRSGGTSPPKRVRYRCRHKDGRTIWVEAQPTLLTDPDNGEPVGFSDIVRDITEAVEKDAALAASEAQLRFLSEHSHDVVVRVEPGKGVVYASPSCRRFGWEPDELLGPAGFEIIHPEDRPRISALIADMFEGRENRDADREQRMRTKGGDWVWMEGAPTITRDVEGRPTGYVSVLRDISRRKEAEAARAVVEQALAISEVRYRQLADHSSDVIVRISANDRITYVSPSCRIWGYEPEELIGLAGSDLVHPDDLDRVRTLAAALLRGDVVTSATDKDRRIRRKDGGWVWMDGNASFVLDQQGAVVEIITQLRDVTQRRAMEDQLRAARTEAEAAARAKTEFLANMSHEIRTPLTGIIGFAGLLNEQRDLPPQVAKFAHRIATASKTLLSVVNDVLDFSKIEAGQVELDPQPFDPAAFVAETLDLVGGQALAKGLELRTEARGVLPEAVLADSSRVRQVLLNLLGNAIKFTGQGSVSVEITYLEAGGGALRIAVTDTGVGIPKDRVGRLFQRFSQVDGSISRTFGGTGLGLAICKSLAEMMGGEIGVESGAGVGSTFWFTVAAPVVDRSATPLALEDDGWECAPARILVVDDVPVNRELVNAMLGSFGHDLVEAASGLEAVEAAMQQAFDLILMDLQMPGMDGMAATRAIRETCELNRTTPILALSANVMPVHLDGCRAAGMNDHIAKPIDPVELLTKVAKWSGSARAELRVEGRR